MSLPAIPKSREGVRTLMLIVGVFMIAFAVILSLASCTPEAGQNARTAADYEAALLACVDHAHTLEQSHECRDAVAKQFGRPTRWTVLDAGRQSALVPMTADEVFGPADAGDAQ